MKQLVITAVGPDRPGLVDEVSGYLLAQGANLADSRMVNLRGRFALILLVEVEDDKAAAIAEEAAKAGEKIGLRVTVSYEEDDPAVQSGGLSFQLKTFAMDQPGIVHRITHLLHEHHVNIEELQTRLETGSYTGTPQFSMQMCITIPADLSIKQLRGELEQLCESLNCNLDITPAD